MVPVLDEDGGIMGVVTEGNMTKQILSGRAQPNATVEDAGVVYKTFKKLSMNDTLSDLASALDIEPYGECFCAAAYSFNPHSNACIATFLSTGNHRAAVLCGQQKETNGRWRRRRQERGIEWNGSREEERRQCHHYED